MINYPYLGTIHTYYLTAVNTVGKTFCDKNKKFPKDKKSLKVFSSCHIVKNSFRHEILLIINIIIRLSIVKQ